MTDPVVKTVEVPCTAAEAFDVFVNRIATWWPLDTHAASASAGKAALTVTIEPRVGGKVVETKYDGSTDLWGEVTLFVPGERIAFSWHPGNNKACPTSVDVRFETTAERRTRVTLTHSGWEAWAERADEMRGNYHSGWDVVFGQCYARSCIATAA